jgi:chromosome segregation ATPase
MGAVVATLVIVNRIKDEKQEYQRKLQENITKYQGEISSLKQVNDSLEKQVSHISNQVDSLNISIGERTAALDSIKQEYDEQIDNITSMSHHELVEFFSNRY